MTFISWLTGNNLRDILCSFNVVSRSLYCFHNFHAESNEWYITSPMGHTASWEDDSRSSCQQIPILQRNRWFIAILLKVHHWTLSWVSLIQSTPSFLISLRLFLILSFRPHLGLQRNFLPSGFPAKMYAFIYSLACYMSHPWNSLWFYQLPV
jgi:hypothetical protein